MSAGRSSDGYLICDVHGCEEHAEPWSYELPIGGVYDDVDVEVYLCRRHARAITGSTESNASEASA